MSSVMVVAMYLVFTSDPKLERPKNEFIYQHSHYYLSSIKNFKIPDIVYIIWFLYFIWIMCAMPPSILYYYKFYILAFLISSGWGVSIMYLLWFTLFINVFSLYAYVRIAPSLIVKVMVASRPDHFSSKQTEEDATYDCKLI